MEELIALDKKLFLYLNGHHSPWLDQTMFAVTNTLFWLPLYAVLSYLLILNYKKCIWIFLIGIALTVLLSDQVTSALMKPYFERLRPSHDPELMNAVHIVNNYKGGKYGFASSHAANTFGVATFVFLALRNFRSWVKWIFTWAVLVTYSRIYLGVHYPGDILVGGIIGALFGYSLFHASRFVFHKMKHRKVSVEKKYP